MNSDDARPVQRPFTAFNFEIEIVLPGRSAPLCNAAFSECSGLEQSIQLKTIREGGNNARQIHLTGPVAYGQLTLKRGMSPSFDLWDWFDEVSGPGGRGVRAAAVVTMLESNLATRAEKARFVLEGCLPVRLKAPPLNGASGGIAIEELTVAYERLKLQKPGEEG